MIEVRRQDCRFSLAGGLMTAFKTIFVAGATLLSLMSGALAQPTPDVAQPTPDLTQPITDPETDVPPFERMVAGQVRIMKTAIPYSDVLVGASDVADISPMSDQRIAITAKKEGMTSLMIIPVDRTLPSAHVAIQVVPPAQFKKTAVQVRSIGGDGHSLMSYWCDQPSGCLPDEKNYSKASSRSVTETVLPGGGISRTTTSTLR